MASYSTLGAYILSKRKLQGIAIQAELAQQLGVTQQTVSRWEAGASRPRTDMLAKLAEILKVETTELSAAAGYTPNVTTVSFDLPLPLPGLSPESFERFSLDFLAALYQGQADVHPAGKTGHKQYGIDIEARFDKGDLFTFQCKRESQFGPAKVRKAIKAQITPAKKKYILLSRVASPEARKEIKKARGWDIWDQADVSRLFRTLPRFEQGRIVDIYFPSQRFALTGEMSPGPWLTATDFFASQLVEGRFNHLWKLVGRASELDQLAQALANREVIVTNLIGRAGEGKSRVLRSALESFSAAHPHVCVVVASPTEEIDAKGLENLGAREKLIVVDDAHDREDLNRLIHYVADDRTNTRLLLAYRPYWTEVVQAELARNGLIAPLVEPVTLTKPTKKDAMALASQVLTHHGASTASAEIIADIAYDSPLAVVVGAQIVAKEGVHPELFRSNEVFLITVLKRYEQMIAEDIATGKDQDRVCAMLRVLALIQPVAQDDQCVIELLTSIEGIRAPDATRLTHLLIRSGVLFKRGALYRLSPDMLADSIIESACIKSSGESNGYAEQIFDAAIPEHKEHILLNLGRLDWRRNEGDTSASRLLDGIWSKLAWEDGYQHAQVTAAVSAAYYQPRQALDFARRMVDQGHGTDEDVCRIIHGASYSLKHLPKACELLWEVGKSDKRPTNQYPHHPLRLLTELAAPEPGKSIAYNEKVIEFALSLLPFEDSWNDAATPLDILEGALKTEGYTSRAIKRRVAFSAFGVNIEAVAAMRRPIIDAILESLTIGHKRRAFSAAKLLENAVRGPVGLLNRKPTDTEQADWSQEFIDTLTRVNEVLDANHVPAVVLVRLGQSVSWHAYYSKGATREPARRIINRLDRDFETRVTRALMDAWGHDTWEPDSEDLDINAQRQEQLAEEIEKRFPDVARLAQFLDERLSDLKSYAEELLYSSHVLVNGLIEKQLSLARKILDAGQQNPQSPLANYGSVALSSLLRQAPAEAHNRISAFISQGEGYLPMIARAYAASPFGTRQVNDDDRSILRQIFRSGAASTLRHTSEIFREVAQKDKHLAIELLTNANPALAQDPRGGVFMWLRNDRLIPFDSISDENLKRIIQLLLTPDRLDEHWMLQFLARVAKRNPRQVLKLAKTRLERAIAENNWEYKPIGGRWDTTKSLNLLEHREGAAMFRETLDWALSKPTNYLFLHRFAELVAEVFGFTESVFTSVLETWIAGGNAAHFAIVAAVLLKAPRLFVFNEHEFVLRILRAARSVGTSAHRGVSSSLYGTAVSGIRSGAPGEPFPEDIDMKKRAEEMLASISQANPAYELYDDIRHFAQDNIERQLAEGRAMDEEEADE